MKTILVATTNQGKFEQIKRVFEDYNITNICSLKDVMPVDEPEEYGSTCQQNARIKAEYYAEKYPEYCVLADDSGIFIDEFDGAPGVYSARWGGAHNTKNIREKLLSELKNHNISESPAHYECSMVFLDKSNDEFTVICQGIFNGTIKNVASGTFRNGLAYDPYFYIDEYNATAADLMDRNEEALLEINHRGKAAKQMAISIIKAYFNEKSIITMEEICL
jgi:XTP/dITP diphosphohydrolase